MTDRVVVVGAGIGGLAVAIRLAAAGRRVVVLERNEVTGGKMRSERHEAFTFDTGPSLLTLPDVLDDLFRVAGTSLAGELDMVRLDPQFHYRWPDGSELVVPDRPATRRDAFDAFSPGAGAAWARFDELGRRIWEVSERTFLAGPMTGAVALARRMRSPADLLAIDPLRSLHRSAAAHFDDPRLVQWAGRYATYSGSSPFRAPATLACIQHLESRDGCWYPRGGLDAVRAALAARRRGVGRRRAHTSGGRRDRRRRRDRRGRRAGRRVDRRDVGGRRQRRRRARLRRAAAGRRPRCGGCAGQAARRVAWSILVAAAGTTPGVGHHNVWFSGDDRAEFAAIDRGRMADDPTIYACVSSVTDPTQAPAGNENWFLLVNAPPGIALDRDAERRRLLDVLASRGVDLRQRTLWSNVITPLDIAGRYRAPAGAIYGSSSNGRRAAFLRPGNRGARRGLYLVGGSSHPGGGLPLVLTSARIVADLIA